MKIAIVGSRNFDDHETVVRELDAVLDEKGVTRPTIVSGGAPGVDTTAKRIAQSRGYPYVEYPADWKKYGRAAGPIRNKQIVEESEFVLAFVAPNSKGTLVTIKMAGKAGIPVKRVDVK